MTIIITILLGQHLLIISFSLKVSYELTCGREVHYHYSLKEKKPSERQVGGFKPLMVQGTSVLFVDIQNT